MSPGFQRFTSSTSSHRRINQTLDQRIAIYFPAKTTFLSLLHHLSVVLPSLTDSNPHITLNSLFLSARTVFLTSFLPFHPALYFTSAHTPTTVTELMSSFGFMSSNSFLLHSYFISVQSLTSLKSPSLSRRYPPTVHLPQWFTPPQSHLSPLSKNILSSSRIPKILSTFVFENVFFLISSGFLWLKIVI